MEKINLIERTANKKLILLDLDNTLYKYSLCHSYAIKKVYLYFKHKIKNISFKDFLARYKKAKGNIKKILKKNASSHSRFLYFQNMLEMEFCKTCFKDTVALESIYWSAFIEKMKLYDWVIPFLNACKKDRKRIVIVTDLTSKVQFQKIMKLGLAKYIDFIVTSEEVNADKPSSKIFRLALKKSASEAELAIIIGDDKEKDKSDFIKSIII